MTNVSAFRQGLHLDPNDTSAGYLQSTIYYLYNIIQRSLFMSLQQQPIVHSPHHSKKTKWTDGGQKRNASCILWVGATCLLTRLLPNKDDITFQPTKVYVPVTSCKNVFNKWECLLFRSQKSCSCLNKQLAVTPANQTTTRIFELIKLTSFAICISSNQNWSHNNCYFPTGNNHAKLWQNFWKLYLQHKS